MDEPDEDRVRERDLDRFLTFVDAIVAIAITLLVLPLVELRDELDAGSVRALLDVHQSQIWAFLLSFAVISRLWFIQHSSVRHVVRYDRAVANLTMVWVLTIVFLPFPTSLVAAAPDDPATKVLYVGTMALGTTCHGLMEHVLVRRPGLSDGAGQPDPVSAWVILGLLLVALLLMLTLPVLSYAPLILLAVDDRIRRLLPRRTGRSA